MITSTCTCRWSIALTLKQLFSQEPVVDASCCGLYLSCSQALVCIHLTSASSSYSLVSPADSVSIKSLLTSPVTQKFLYSKLDDHAFDVLLNSSSVADKGTSFVSFFPSCGILHDFLLCPLRVWGCTWIPLFSRVPSKG